MNFLSHYYFTQDEPNPYYTLGSLLPDLFRNHRANWKFNPEKQPELFAGDDDLEHLLRGWSLHLEVDHLFHDAALFKQESSILRKDLVRVFQQLPKRPFFLAHIGYELLLDSLLIRHRLVDTHKFYATLAACQTEVIERFLNKLGMYHNERFYDFLDDFISSRYLESYAKTESIVYALDRIGRRVWIEPFSEEETRQTVLLLQENLERLEADFFDIFDELLLNLKGLQ